MPCREVMVTDLPALREGDSVWQALQILTDHNCGGLPVVDDNGRYVGMLRLRDLLVLALPKAVAADTREHMNLAFVQDTMHDLRARLNSLGKSFIKNYISTDTPALNPDTSLVETLLLLYRKRSILPVVNPDTHQLLGVVTILDALSRIGQE
jgi:CBS domain-containing protein